ncbi:hypothetical protein V7O61_12900 [Methanolobus sp. WCC1]|uniref:hypothetical protein n=1 Tax=unclassified Methanolobus TaxID=2629569 RepID=UPI003256873F
MKHKILKVLACISLAAMVLGAITPGAFADETGTADEAKEFGDHKMMHGPGGAPEMGDEDMEAPVFDSEEEEMEFLVEKETEHITKRIEMLNEKLAETEDEEEQAEIEEQIAELEDLLEDIESAETLDDLKEILETARESMMTENPVKGERPEMEDMEFASDDEEMEFLVERQTESINKRLEMLQEMLDNIDEIEDENITSDSIEEQMTELEDLLADIESATTLDELKEILEEYRENNPQPHGHGGEHGPMGHAAELEEEVSEE